VAEGTWSRPALPGQGDISAVCWTQDNQIWTVDRWHRATRSLASGAFTTTRQVQNPTHWLELLDLYLLKPLYFLLPKPGETGNLVNYLLTDQRTILAGQSIGGLRAPRVPITIWSPLLSHAGFLAALLAAGCWMIQQRDY
jgi:hypothetical protein